MTRGLQAASRMSGAGRIDPPKKYPCILGYTVGAADLAHHFLFWRGAPIIKHSLWDRTPGHLEGRGASGTLGHPDPGAAGRIQDARCR